MENLDLFQLVEVAKNKYALLRDLLLKNQKFSELAAATLFQFPEKDAQTEIQIPITINGETATLFVIIHSSTVAGYLYSKDKTAYIEVRLLNGNTEMETSVSFTDSQRSPSCRIGYKGPAGWTKSNSEEAIAGLDETIDLLKKAMQA